MRRTTPALLAALVAGALSLGGCASKDYVNEQVAGANTRLDATQGQLRQVELTAQDALKRATAAGKLAEGKFLYAMVLSDDSVKFPFDSAHLSAEAEQRISAFVEKLKADNRNVYVEVQGHTDASGSEMHNRRLGAERAEAVRLFMNQQGVPLNRMATISYGESGPAADNTTRAGRAQNRRVVLIVMS